MRIILAIASLLLCSLASAQSGVITAPGGGAQCYVLIDSVPGTPGCSHRASVACVIGGAGYVGSAPSSQSAPVYPLAIQLRQLPNYVSAGVLTIDQLPSVAGGYVQASINGNAGAWVLSAPFSGESCAPVTSQQTLPPVQPWFSGARLAEYCRTHPAARACRG